MSDTPSHAAFEAAFHRSAERHERAWVFIALLLLAVLMVGLMFFGVAAYGTVVQTAGFQKDPAASSSVGPTTEQGLVRTGPNTYSVRMLAHLWSWTPSPLHEPQGAAITLYVTSSDVLHGFEVQGTTINVTAVPGITGTATYTFTHAGTYNVICNEFCGMEHQAMIGRIIVDPAGRS